MKPRPSRPQSAVVVLADARLERRLSTYRERLNKVLTVNKRAVGRLYTTGLLFTRDGARAGRDLLLAHQHLLRVITLVDRLSAVGDVPAPRSQAEIDSIFSELDLLLDRTGELTQKTSELLARLKPEA